MCARHKSIPLADRVDVNSTEVWDQRPGKYKIAHSRYCNASAATYSHRARGHCAGIVKGDGFIFLFDTFNDSR
jgi:hypothetical protein